AAESGGNDERQSQAQRRNGAHSGKGASYTGRCCRCCSRSRQSCSHRSCHGNSAIVVTALPHSVAVGVPPVMPEYWYVRKAAVTAAALVPVVYVETAMQFCRSVSVTFDAKVDKWASFVNYQPRFVLLSVRKSASTQLPGELYLRGRSTGHWDLSYKDLPGEFRSPMLDRINSRVAAAEFRVPDNLITISNWFASEWLLSTYPFEMRDMNISNFGIEGLKTTSRTRSFYIHGPHGLCVNDYGLLGVAESPLDKCSWVRRGFPSPVFYYAKWNGTFQSSVGYADQLLVYME
uniref:FBA_1 domain-containing protein n=1 Tax=Macrostomum lignano TaxID=282301 RepID=A0A1I8IVM5_9PLAT